MHVITRNIPLVCLSLSYGSQRQDRGQWLPTHQQTLSRKTTIKLASEEGYREQHTAVNGIDLPTNVSEMKSVGERGRALFYNNKCYS